MKALRTIHFDSSRDYSCTNDIVNHDWMVYVLMVHNQINQIGDTYLESLYEKRYRNE